MIKILFLLITTITAELSWDNDTACVDTCPTSFRLYVSKTPGNYTGAATYDFPLTSTTLSGDRRIATVSNWDSSDKRYCRLTALNEGGESEPSNEIVIKGKPKKPMQFLIIRK